MPNPHTSSSVSRTVLRHAFAEFMWNASQVELRGLPELRVALAICTALAKLGPAAAPATAPLLGMLVSAMGRIRSARTHCGVRVCVRVRVRVRVWLQKSMSSSAADSCWVEGSAGSGVAMHARVRCMACEALRRLQSTQADRALVGLLL